MTVSTGAQESESVGMVPPESREHLWAAYEAAVKEWEKASAVERAQYGVYKLADEAWQAKRDEECATWRRSREAFDAWQQAVDALSAREEVR